MQSTPLCVGGFRGLKDMKHKVFLCEYIHPSAQARLAAEAEIISDPARLAECDAAINRNLKMDDAWQEKCPNMRVIGIHGTGTDGVDLVAAKARGIRVVNTPGENALSVAELVVTFALMLSRHVAQFDRALLAGEPLVNGGGTLTGMELTGKTFGMVGCGEIAMIAARKLQAAFDMRLVGYSPSLTEEKAARLGIVRCATPAEVFEQADIVNIGAKLIPETVDLVDAEVLSHAKPGCMLINTARGPIVNEKALYEALTSGRLAAAACDVFAQEPPTKENPLVGLPNFIATPHIGANTEEALSRVSNSVVEQVLALLNDTPCEKMHIVV